MLQHEIYTAKRFIETLSYLKPAQIYGRLLYKSNLVSISKRGLPKLSVIDKKQWQLPPTRRKSQSNPREFTFLNQTHHLNEIGWDNENIEKLWRYNLHYFDDLNARDAKMRKVLHAATIENWIEGNPHFTGTGWEPYPTSLRIVNWLKWHFAGNALSVGAQQSLALQARWLHHRYETHLLGNHLFANAKAMLFASKAFEGAEAKQWHDKASAIILAQLDEQILEDGGHFELSPMYHAIILEDCLDILNLIQISDCPQKKLNTLLCQKVPSMLKWLETMCHPDGEISFFNDAAIGIAPNPGELLEYARRLNITPIVTSQDDFTHLASSGYIRVETGGLCALMDVGKIGPEYLTGHAHADTLSFEASIGDERFIVNSGTSLYGICKERQRQRGTPAHNTLCINGRNSSDVWHGFRTGKRAYPGCIHTRKENDYLIEASHDGYAPVSHNRRWQVDETKMIIEDSVLPSDPNTISRLHLHPDLKVTRSGNRFECISPKGSSLCVIAEIGEPKLVATTWHPEFGISKPNTCIEMKLIDGIGKIRMQWKCNEEAQPCISSS